MPQASEHLQQEMIRRFGSIMTEGPEKFLVSKGWTLNRGWTWSKPGVVLEGLNEIPLDEYECILFLAHEWDYGGIV